MERIPMAEARLELPMASLLNLPEGAEYRKQCGRVSATVRNEGDNMVVYATCDSLQALVDYYERVVQGVSRQSSQQEQKSAVRTEKIRSSNLIKITLIAFIAGVVAGTVLTIKTRRIWKKVF